MPHAAPDPVTGEVVKKGMVRNARRVSENARVVSENARKVSEDAAKASTAVRRIKPKHVAAAAGGTVATLGAASAAGNYAGSRAGVKAGISRSMEISKVDEDKRQIFGWANHAIVDGQPVVDLQGDYVSIEEIEKSAYGYMLTSRVGGHMHSRIGKGYDGGPVHVADVVESFVVTPDKLEAMGLSEDALPLGWWVGMQVNDEDVWQKVKSGELAGLSIHGTGTRKDMVFA